MPISSIDRRAINSEKIVDGRLVTTFVRVEFGDGSQMHPAGTIVCEQPTKEERAKDYGPAEFGGILSETVTRLGVLFWDEGEFTPACSACNGTGRATTATRLDGDCETCHGTGTPH